MARVYHRDQAGAPNLVVTSQANTFLSIKRILIACLVQGSPTHVAAGWELIAEGDRFLVIRSASGYLGITHPSENSNYAEVWLSKTFTGVVSNRLTGDGLKSGTAANNGSPQIISCNWQTYSDAYTGWYVLADERSFMFAIASRWESSGSIEDGYALTLYAGETSSGVFLSVGGANRFGTALSKFNSDGLTLLTHPYTGLLLGSSAISGVIPALPLNGQPQDASVLTIAEVEMCKVRVFGDGYSAGYLRGVTAPLELGNRTTKSCAESLGLIGAFTTRRLNESIELSDSATWFVIPRVSESSGAAALCTDRSDYW